MTITEIVLLILAGSSMLLSMQVLLHNQRLIDKWRKSNDGWHALCERQNSQWYEWSNDIIERNRQLIASLKEISGMLWPNGKEPEQ